MRDSREEKAQAAPHTLAEDAPSPRRFFLLDNVPVTLIGEPRDWFTVERAGQTVIIRPTEPLSDRCTIRPAALFLQDSGLLDVNTVMGRLLFVPGTGQEQRYTPFTRDPHRQLRELFLMVERTPDDDALVSHARWLSYEGIARRLLNLAEVPWDGLQERDIKDLLRLEPWLQPLEGCVLHALAQSVHALGKCVLEIGSLRGQSTSMLAMALRGVGSDSTLISIDPHTEEPHNHAQVRLTLEQIGEQQRLVQFACSSNDAWPVLRPGVASLVFVDGDHSYQQVAADFANYCHLVAPGGCILFHDYGYGAHNGRPDVVPDVRPAIDEHVLPTRGFRPLLLAHTLLALRKGG